MGNFTRLSRLLERRAFIYPGRTDTIKSCGYVKDLISSMFFMSSRNEGISIYNFCYEHRYTISEICSAFSQATGYSKPTMTIPIWLMILAVLPFEILQAVGIKSGINRERIKKLWFSTNILPKRLVANGFKFEYDMKGSLTEWNRESTIKDFD